MGARVFKDTRNSGIIFERQHENECIIGFVDSNYTGDLDKQQFTIVHFFT